MKLEPIDTSTTAGKAEVMRLADEGRKLVWRFKKARKWIPDCGDEWDWPQCDYAIIAEPVGPDVVWLVITPNTTWNSPHDAEQLALKTGGTVVRYRRVEE